MSTTYQKEKKEIKQCKILIINKSKKSCRCVSSERKTQPFYSFTGGFAEQLFYWEGKRLKGKQIDICRSFQVIYKKDPL